MRVNTNSNSLLALRNLEKNSEEEKTALNKLSSGDRILSASYDPSGLAISEKMRARLVSQGQAKRNMNDGISMLQVAEGSLSELSGLGVRLRELAIQASTDTVDDFSRQIANKEFGELKEEVKRLTQSSKFNGNSILNGTASYDLQIGVNNNISEDRVSYNLSKILDAKGNFGLDSIDLSSKVTARNSIAKIDKMMGQVGLSRAKLGASQNRLESMNNNINVSMENLSSAKSLIRDADVAEETANNMKAKIKKDATVMMLQTVNSNPNKVLKLLS
ncbi:flagellin [Halobacteriovorax sp.]|uniref:flagellin n=1 Tax=Halobacteriovorax sp. TaxID=2020862 RepID=UPI0035682DD0